MDNSNSALLRVAVARILEFLGAAVFTMATIFLLALLAYGWPPSAFRVLMVMFSGLVFVAIAASLGKYSARNVARMLYYCIVVASSIFLLHTLRILWWGGVHLDQ